MEAILACHPAISTQWLDWLAKWCERCRMRTGPIGIDCKLDGSTAQRTFFGNNMSIAFLHHTACNDHAKQNGKQGRFERKLRLFFSCETTCPMIQIIDSTKIVRYLREFKQQLSWVLNFFQNLSLPARTQLFPTNFLCAGRPTCRCCDNSWYCPGYRCSCQQRQGKKRLLISPAMSDFWERAEMNLWTISACLCNDPIGTQFLISFALSAAWAPSGTISSK